MGEFMKSPPRFSSTVLPIPPKEVELSIAYLCMQLTDLNLEEMRRVLDSKGYARHLRNLRGPAQMEIHQIQEPLDLGIVVLSRFESLLVRLRPEDFDQALDEQRLLYQKCVGILEILSSAPVGRTVKKLAVSILKFRINESELEQQRWGKVLERWKRNQQLPPSHE
jgi:hypothetical protein